MEQTTGNVDEKVSADAIPRRKPLLIFKGNDGQKNSRLKKEMSQYDSEL